MVKSNSRKSKVVSLCTLPCKVLFCPDKTLAIWETSGSFTAWRVSQIWERHFLCSIQSNTRLSLGRNNNFLSISSVLLTDKTSPIWTSKIAFEGKKKKKRYKWGKYGDYVYMNPRYCKNNFFFSFILKSHFPAGGIFGKGIKKNLC